MDWAESIRRCSAPPIGMNGGRVWFELHHLVLLWVYQPAFSSGLLRWFMGGAVTGQGGWGDGNRGQLCKALLPEQHLASRWRIRSLDRGPIRAGSLSGLKGAGESNGTLMDALLLCSRKRSLSQSKRGLREASGDLGLRPQSNQGVAPLHWLMRESRFSSKISSIFLFL